MKKLAILFLGLLATPLLAQSTANNVVPGYLSSSNHSCGQTTCFVAYGSAGPSGGTITPLGATTTNGSSTVATGGTFQSALASSATRKGCLIQNPTTATEPLYVYFGANGSATTANSISLGAGASVSCNAGTIVLTDNVSVTATTSTHAFIVMSQ